MVANVAGPCSRTLPRPARDDRAIEARAAAGMAAAAVAADADLEPDGVLVAVDAHLDDALDLAAGGALAPQLARASATSTRPRRWRACGRGPRRSCGRPSGPRRSRRRSSTQVMSPSAPKRGVRTAPSSSSAARAGGGKGGRSVMRGHPKRKAPGAGGRALHQARSGRAVKPCRSRDQRQEADLLGRIVLEEAGELGRQGRGALLLHAAHRHAQMLGLEHHGDAARLQDLVDRLGDLRRHGLLGLQAAGKASTRRASFDRPTTPPDG